MKHGVLIALAIGIFVFISGLLLYLRPERQSHFEIDSAGYEAMAHYFLQHGSLHDPLHPHHHPIHTIGYPFFINIIYGIGGPDYKFIVVAQIILSILCGLLLYGIGQTLGMPIVGLIALMMWSVNLGFLLFTQYVLSEILLCTFLLLFLYCLAQWRENNSMRWLAASGLVLSFSVIVKPAALYFILPLCVGIYYVQRIPRQKMYVSLAILLVSFYTPLAVYVLRNKLVYGYAALSPLSNQLLYIDFGSHVKAALEGTRVHDVRTTTQWFSGTGDYCEDEQWQGAKYFLFTILKEHPLLLVRLAVENVCHTLFGLFSTQLKVFLHPELKGGACSFTNTHGTILYRLYAYTMMCTTSFWIRLISLLELCWLFVRYALVCVALWMLVQKKNYDIVLFCLLYLCYFLMITAHDGYSRLRMMTEPLFIFLTAVGIWHLWWYASSIRRRKI